MAPPIPQSQKNIVRNIARRAWRTANCDAALANKEIDQRIGREIGGAWVLEGRRIAGDLIDYWEENGITDPAAVFVAGEPGMQNWDD